MTRASAIRLAGWSVAIVVLLLPLVALLQGWVAKGSWPVRSLRVDAPFKHVDAAAIRAAATPLLAAGFFAVDLDQVRQRVAALPWVARVEVRKHWPDQVDLRIEEQQAFARWNGEALLNRHGQRFVVPDLAAQAALPDLSGPEERLDEVLAFYLDSRKRFAAIGREVVGAHLSDRGAWRLDLDHDTGLMIGRSRPQQRLARFIDSYDKLMRGHAGSFDYVDLRYSNGYAVRWPPTPSIDGGPPKA